MNYGMPRPSKAERAELAKYVLDERTARMPRDKRPDGGARGSTSEDSGMSYGGRPRNAKGRRKATTGHAPTRFASYHPWKG